MNEERLTQKLARESGETADSLEFDFSVDRRTFVQVLGAGLMVALTPTAALAQNRGRGGGNDNPRPVSTRIHIAEDGSVTVLSGKIEMGQGARTELAQAAAEELRVPFSQVNMILGDTGLVPDDGLSAGQPHDTVDGSSRSSSRCRRPQPAHWVGGPQVEHDAEYIGSSRRQDHGSGYLTLIYLRRTRAFR